MEVVSSSLMVNLFISQWQANKHKIHSNISEFRLYVENIS